MIWEISCLFDFKNNNYYHHCTYYSAVAFTSPFIHAWPIKGWKNSFFLFTKLFEYTPPALLETAIHVTSGFFHFIQESEINDLKFIKTKTTFGITNIYLKFNINMYITQDGKWHKNTKRLFLNPSWYFYLASFTRIC